MPCSIPFHINLFLSTPSARRATSGAVTIAAVAGFLSTPSARRATLYNLDPRPGRMDFYPRPPRGGRRAVLPGAELPRRISIHALREEGDNCSSLAAAMTGRISIHALREEGDRWLYRMFHRYLISIHALREEGDMAVRAGCCCSTYFYPRPPRGGRLQRARQRPARFFISIHALREEGDLLDRWEEYSLETFLSTPSARRATVLRRGGVLGARISIHALREEGDQVPCVSFPLTS